MHCATSFTVPGILNFSKQRSSGSSPWQRRARWYGGSQKDTRQQSRRQKKGWKRWRETARLSRPLRFPGPSPAPMPDIRPAVPGGAGRLTEISHAAKRHWGYPEEWIRIWRQELVVSPGCVAETPDYVADAGVSPVGFIGLDPRAQDEEVDHLWVMPHRMGKGIGRQLVERAPAHCREVKVKCCSRVHATARAPGAHSPYAGIDSGLGGAMFRRQRRTIRTIPR